PGMQQVDAPYLQRFGVQVRRISVLRDGGNVGVTDVADSDIDRLVEMMVGRRLECSRLMRLTCSDSACR
ncbi:hypothetical protein, partial [Vibrio parahaemolyticus]